MSDDDACNRGLGVKDNAPDVGEVALWRAVSRRFASMLLNNADNLIQRVIDSVREGNTTALQICADRLIPHLSQRRRPLLDALEEMQTG